MRDAVTTFVFAALAALVLPLAADTGPWFGTPVPQAASDPRRPIMKYDDAFAPLPTRFTSRPGKHDEILDGAALKADHRTIVGFSLESLAAGDTVWGRRATTPSFMHTIEWTVSALKSAGLADAKVETFAVPGPMWVPRSWSVTLAGDPAFGPGTAEVTLHSAFPQPGGVSIPSGGLTAPVVFAGRGTEADLAGRDVRGKIAVIHVRPEPSLFGSAEQGAAARLVAKGALGVINAVEGPGNAFYYDTRFACGKAPCFMVGGEDGWFLEHVIGKAGNAGLLDRLKMTLALTAEERSGLTSANGVA